MGKKIAIIGAGGHGKVVADIAKLNGYEEILFLDDDTSKKQNGLYPVTGKVSDYKKYKNQYDFFVAIGNNEIRKKISEELLNDDIRLINLIHPSAILDTTLKLADGIVIMANAVVNTDTNLARGVIVNTGATVDHDCNIGSYTHICPGVHIAGSVEIGSNVWIGIGASVINRIRICNDVTVGAGAIVIRDLVEHGTYIGIPARRIGGDQ
ncbi:MAG: acetyltransferase [Thomasclavelia sp.]